MPSSDCHATRFATFGGGSHQSYGTRDVYVTKLAVATGRRSTGSTTLVRRWRQNWMIVWCGIEIVTYIPCLSMLVCSTGVKGAVYFQNVVLFGKWYSSDTDLTNCWKLPTRKDRWGMMRWCLDGFHFRCILGRWSVIRISCCTRSCDLVWTMHRYMDNNSRQGHAAVYSERMSRRHFPDVFNQTFVVDPGPWLLSQERKML